MIYITYIILFLVTIYCLHAIRKHKKNTSFLQHIASKEKEDKMEMSFYHQEQKSDY